MEAFKIFLLIMRGLIRILQSFAHVAHSLFQRAMRVGGRIWLGFRMLKSMFKLWPTLMILGLSYLMPGLALIQLLRVLSRIGVVKFGDLSDWILLIFGLVKPVEFVKAIFDGVSVLILTIIFLTIIYRINMILPLAWLLLETIEHIFTHRFEKYVETIIGQYNSELLNYMTPTYLYCSIICLPSLAYYLISILITHP